MNLLKSVLNFKGKLYYIITDCLKENIFKIPKKIFVIGFNKTGTTSIHTIIPVMKIINKYDAFTDGNHFDFKKYYNRYPDSLFILNTLPIYSCILSRYKHAKKHKFNNCWCWPPSDVKTCI